MGEERMPLLCRFGVHDWTVWGLIANAPGIFGIMRAPVQTRVCKRCKLVDSRSVQAPPFAGDEWQSGQLPASGTWCWVSDGKSVWIAKHDDHDASHGWTNEDTWEDWEGSITHWIPLEMPAVPEAAL
jgi:hypothetical protein